MVVVRKENERRPMVFSFECINRSRMNTVISHIIWLASSTHFVSPIMTRHLYRATTENRLTCTLRIDIHSAKPDARTEYDVRRKTIKTVDLVVQ